MGNEFYLNKKISDIPEALSIYMNQLVYSEKRKGIDIITLSLGEAFFDIPEFPFSEIDFVKGYHYSDSMGLPELREKILQYYNKKYGACLQDIDKVMISSGSKAIIYMIMVCVLERGDEVLIHEPAWLSYQEQVKLADAVPQFIPYDCSVERFSDYFTDKTKLLVLNNPNNPAGWVYGREQLQYIYNICQEKGVFILIDEAYSDFIGKGDSFFSMTSIAENLEGVFIVNSLSKNMGMSGWRIGYVISHQRNINALLKLNQHIVTCAPTVLQLYIAHYFDKIIEITLPQVSESVRKRNRILEYIDSIGLKHLDGASTFYIFLDMEGLKVDTLDFCLFLLFKYGISTVPGGAYGQSTEKFIRIGIGAESEERIYYALDIIKMVFKENLANEDYVKEKLDSNGFHRFEKVENNRGNNC